MTIPSEEISSKMSLFEYRKSLDSAFDLNSKATIENGSLEHALELYKRFLKYAKKSIK